MSSLASPRVGTSVPTGTRRPTDAVLRELARPRSAADLLRGRMTAAATAGIGVVLLMAASVAGIHDHDVDPGVGYDGVAAQSGLAPYLAQSGLRPGVVMAAVLMVLPFAALTVQALRVGSLPLRRQAGLLALAGATPGDLRRLRVVRTRAAFTRGGLWSAPAFVVMWLLLGLALPPGLRLLPTPQVWLPLGWLLVVALLVVTGSLLGLRSAGADGEGPGGGLELAAIIRPQSAAGRAPSVGWAWGSAAGAAALVVYGLRLAGPRLSVVATLGLLVLVVALLAAAAGVLLARHATRGIRLTTSTPRRLRSLRRARGRDAAVAVLAGAQRRANPVAAATVGAVLFVCGLSFGVADIFSYGVSRADSHASELVFYVGGAAAAAAVAVVGILVALLALALDLTDHLLATRRSVAATAVLGMEPRRLLAVNRHALTATAVPAVMAGTVVGGLLYGSGPLFASPSQAGIGLLTVLLTAAVAGLLVAVLCRLVVRICAGRVRAAAALEHLRTP